MKKFFLLILLFLITASGIFSLVVYKAYHNYTTSSNNPERIFIINKGQNLGRIAINLRTNNLIKEPILFRIFARLEGKDKLIKSGEYKIPAGASEQEILDLIISGNTIVHSITFTEGLTSFDYAKLLNNTPNLTGSTDPIPGNGTLLPETYNYSYNDTRQSIFARMRKSMNEQAENLWQERTPNLPFTSLDQAKVLASIIEREAIEPDERPIIASVFINRLKKKMPLQSDPTVIFAVTGGNFDLNRPITIKDLKIDSPFNTYMHKGLPPKPICNFRLDSLRAALNPAKTNYLYFVVNPNKPNEHLFSATYAEHQSKTKEFHKYIHAQRKKLASKNTLDTEKTKN